MESVHVHVVAVSSRFAVEVFKRIRPRIPRERWPVESLKASFTPSSDGLYLIANFEDLPGQYGAVAAQAVAQAGIDLVVLSPAAYWAAQVVKAKRWRDAALFAAVPLLFAIPLVGALVNSATVMAGILFGADLLALAVTQLNLARLKITLVNTRFVAEIPVPGQKVAVAVTAAAAAKRGQKGD